MEAAPIATDYLRRLAEIHACLRPRTYLEIGVWSGRSLALAGGDTLAIGVDPNPEIAEKLSPSTRIFEESSDSFFALHDVESEFKGLPIDLAFIDGCHLFEFVLRDFANIARHCTTDSRIVLHDTLPQSALMAQRKRETRAWTGDVWKVVPCLRKYAPYLAITTIDVPPTGLTVVSNIGPGDTTIVEHFDRIIAEFMDLDFASFVLARDAFNIVPDGPIGAC